MAGPSTHTTLMVNGNGPPDLPPRVDRNTKPLHGNRSNGGQRSATDRLFSQNGMDDVPNYINATPHHQRTHTSTSKQVLNKKILNFGCKSFITCCLCSSCTTCTIATTAFRHTTVMVFV